MLIARCVEPGTGGPRLAQNEPVKTSEREFAELSGIARNTISKYLRTWEAMAQAGIVPPREEMEPGQDVEGPDQKTGTYYYREAEPPKPQKRKDPSPADEASGVRGRV